MTDTTVDTHELLPHERGTQNWRALHFFNLYRVILAGLFTSLYATQIGPNFFTDYDAPLFFGVSVGYLSLAVANSFIIRQRFLPFDFQILLQGGMDIVAITLLMHAGGGIVSGLGMLLIVSIAGCSVLTEGRTAVFFAALATLAVLIETVLISFAQALEKNVYPQAGLLGAAFFATAFLSFMLARRIRASDALALQRGVHLEYLSQLNEQIVQHIRTGIIVLDIAGRIQLFNDASKRLLGITGNPENYPLAMVAPELAEQVRNWRRGKRISGGLLRTPTSEVELLTTFTRLQRADAVNVLILLEDATLTAQRAQQLKLASLGRLTASIAHEIRNPLGAISHAAQLLKEGPEMAESDERLLRIIIEHCHRVNTIVENVLQLSRRREADAQEFMLEPWVENLVEELSEHYGLAPEDVQLELHATETPVYFDPSQLRQVVWNLCENALRYSKDAPRILLNADVNPESNRPYLDVSDRGTGMSEDVAAQVFEPFFTTEAQGTGLGLYLAREICQSNQAFLHMLSHDETGCRFRISFSSPGNFPDGPSMTSRTT